MKIKAVFLTLFMSICFSVSGQEDSFQQNIIDYLNVNGTFTQYSAAFDQMFDVLKQQYEAGAVPEETWAELKEGRNAAVNQVVGMLSSAYREHFTKPDIEAMITFYKTDAGQQMVKAPDALSDPQRKEVNAFFTSDTGIKINDLREVLLKDISQISEYWSRDLFAATMTKLREKGYTPKN